MDVGNLPYDVVRSLLLKIESPEQLVSDWVDKCSELLQRLTNKHREISNFDHLKFSAMTMKSG